MRQKYILVIIGLLISFGVVRPADAQYVQLGAEYLFERRQAEEEESEYNFTQTYDVILQKRLRPLYDLRLKFQFRAEQGDEDEERLQSLPSVSFYLGNRVISANFGLSKDNVHEKDRKYDLERGYTTLSWSPSYLPKITIQYNAEEKKFSDDRYITTQEDQEEEEEEPGVTEEEEEKTDIEKRLVVRDDYRLVLGMVELNHSYAWEKNKVWRRDIGNEDYDNYDLHNKGRFDYKTAALDDRLRFQSDYEISQHENKNEETDSDEYRSLEQKINMRLHGIPSHRVQLYYNAFLGELQRWPDINSEKSVGNSLKTEILPHQYLKTGLEVSHDNRWDTEDDTRRSTLTYGLKLEPKIPGLFFDPQIPMPPLNTSLLLSSTLNKKDGESDYRTNSALLKGATELYKGIELRTDFEVINKEDYQEGEQWEENLRVDTGFDLRDDLKYYLRLENKWRKERQDKLSPFSEGFEGEVWHLITYRPTDQLFLTLDNKLDYGDNGNTSYSYRIGWAPVPKLRLEARYQSDETDQYLSSEVNINITKTIKFRIKYTYPSDDEVVSFKLTLRT